jgi:hypothetical protein
MNEKKVSKSKGREEQKNGECFCVFLIEKALYLVAAAAATNL